jgi:hypothetical protein
MSSPVCTCSDILHVALAATAAYFFFAAWQRSFPSLLADSTNQTAAKQMDMKRFAECYRQVEDGAKMGCRNINHWVRAPQAGRERKSDKAREGGMHARRR